MSIIKFASDLQCLYETAGACLFSYNNFCMWRDPYSASFITVRSVVNINTLSVVLLLTTNFRIEYLSVCILTAAPKVV